MTFQLGLALGFALGAGSFMAVGSLALARIRHGQRESTTATAQNLRAQGDRIRLYELRLREGNELWRQAQTETHSVGVPRIVILDATRGLNVEAVAGTSLVDAPALRVVES